MQGVGAAQRLGALPGLPLRPRCVQKGAAPGRQSSCLQSLLPVRGCCCQLLLAVVGCRQEWPPPGPQHTAQQRLLRVAEQGCDTAALLLLPGVQGSPGGEAKPQQAQIPVEGA